MSLGFSFAINLKSLPKKPIVKYYYLISIGVLHIVNTYSCRLQYAISIPSALLIYALIQSNNGAFIYNFRLRYKISICSRWLILAFTFA